MTDSLRARLLYAYAQLLLFLARNARAREVLLAFVEQEPRHAEAWALLGFLHAEKGALAESIAAFDRALALKAGDAALYFNSAFALQRAGRHAGAIERFLHAIELDPRLDRAWYGLGLSLAHEGRYDEAVFRFREAARLQPLNPHAGYELAAVLFKLGRREELRAEYERVKGFDPVISAQISREFGVGP